jgi:excisionase family DNA binding protein
VTNDVAGHLRGDHPHRRIPGARQRAASRATRVETVVRNGNCTDFAFIALNAFIAKLNADTGEMTMTTLTLKHMTAKPTVETAAVAKAYRSALRHVGHGRVKIKAAGTKGEISLPIEVAKMLGTLLTALGEGKSVSLTTQGCELTTVEAAKRLGVSRPFVIAQIEAGRLRCRMVGSHRRITDADCDAFAQRMQRSGKALQDLADQAQELGLGY